MRKSTGSVPTVLTVISCMWLCIAFGSCGRGLLDDISRTAGDPTVVAPTVGSFNVYNQVDVGWQSDSNADEYILERALDAGNPTWMTVYDGQGTSYADSDCSDKEQYLYRLTKLRGSRDFGPSEVSLGVASATTKDSYEPNGDEANATVLDTKKFANLYCFNSTYQQGGKILTLQDRDWYAVTVPPRMTARVVIVESTVDEHGSTTHMKFCQEGLAAADVVENNAIDVVNSLFNTQTFYFEVYPDPSQFETAGGMVISYSIWVDQLVSN